MKLLSQVNEYADNVPLKTMINYGYAHDDKWVRRMALIIELCLDNIGDFKDIDDIKEYFEEYSLALSEAKVAADYAELDKDEAETEAEKWRDRYNSTKYDSDYTLRATVEEALKSQVYMLSEQLKEEKNSYKRLRDDYCGLEEEHKHLQEKYNTWTVLAT